MPRFAILEHVLPAGRHWDLLLEVSDHQRPTTASGRDDASYRSDVAGRLVRQHHRPSRLATWALERPPTPGTTIAARRLPDHRRLYLDYEGPISGDRGGVTRWDAGQYEPIEQTPTRWHVDLHGTRVDGRAILELVEHGSPVPPGEVARAEPEWRFTLESR